MVTCHKNCHMSQKNCYDNVLKQKERKIVRDYKKLSTPNTACAVDVLKSHIENELI